MSEEEIKLIDGYFNKGWCCDLDEVYNTVMKVVKRNKQLEKQNERLLYNYNERVQEIIELEADREQLKAKIEELELQNEELRYGEDL